VHYWISFNERLNCYGQGQAKIGPPKVFVCVSSISHRTTVCTETLIHDVSNELFKTYTIHSPSCVQIT